MERLRAAEKVAKERRLYLYANHPSAASCGKSNGPSSNGQFQIFDATVVRVWSGDQVSVVGKDSALERRLQLSSTRGPKYVSPTFKLSAPFLHSSNLGSLILDKPSTRRKLENFLERSSLVNTLRFTLTLFALGKANSRSANVQPSALEDTVCKWCLVFRV